MATNEGGPVDAKSNAILRRLHPAEFERLRPHMQAVVLRAQQVLYERGRPIEHVYFPTRGCVSLIIGFADGFQAETGVVGVEGMVGLPLIHEVETDAADAVVQIPGAALRIPAGLFLQELGQMPHLRRLLNRYAETMRAQAMQIAACNGHHDLEHRLARCLLMMADHSRSNELAITQEFLAILLCSHRPSVSVAAGRLQRAGLIRYSVGQLVLLDRMGVESVACECYHVMRDRLRSITATS